MKRANIVIVATVASIVHLSVFASSAKAIPAFWAEFEKAYVKADSKDPKDQEFAKLAGKKNKETGYCNICHINKKSKKKRNTYGMALSELLDKKNYTTKRRREEPEAVAKEIQEAFAKVAKQPSDSKDKESPKFGELIEEGKLPGKVIEDEEDDKESAE